MSNPTLLSLALSNGHAESTEEIFGAIVRDRAALTMTEAEERATFAVSSLEEREDRREGAGIMGLARTDDGRTVETTRWTADALRHRNEHRLAGNPADSLAACFDTPARFEAMRDAVR